MLTELVNNYRETVDLETRLVQSFRRLKTSFDTQHALPTPLLGRAFTPTVPRVTGSPAIIHAQCQNRHMFSLIAQTQRCIMQLDAELFPGSPSPHRELNRLFMALRGPCVHGDQLKRLCENVDTYHAMIHRHAERYAGLWGFLKGLAAEMEVAVEAGVVFGVQGGREGLEDSFWLGMETLTGEDRWDGWLALPGDEWRGVTYI